MINITWAPGKESQSRESAKLKVIFDFRSIGKEGRTRESALDRVVLDIVSKLLRYPMAMNAPALEPLSK
jgi:hypothetical protein